MQACEEPNYPARVVVVASDREDAPALESARTSGIPVEVVAWDDYRADRRAFTRAIVKVLEAHAVDLVVLAGFMRILSIEAVEAFPNAILNTHPALLPSFRGAHAVREALEAGVKITGATVHVVSEDVDAGPIVAQEAVPVLDGDGEASLHERILEVEHRLLPEVIAHWAQGFYKIDNGIVREQGNEKP